MIKTAESIQMSYDISDDEKEQAKQAIICFNYAKKYLKKALIHLDIMKTPFKNNPEIKPEELHKSRAAIRRFRDKSVDFFNEFKKQAFECVKIMHIFSSDTQTIKLIKSFINSIDELENKVNKFIELFEDLKSKELTKNIVEIIESIQKQGSSISEIINDRIISHIQSNILASTWVDTIGSELKSKIDKKVPLIMELFNKQQEQIRGK
jgi:DNA-binding ferritin-like protein (Dps family)